MLRFTNRGKEDRPGRVIDERELANSRSQRQGRSDVHDRDLFYLTGTRILSWVIDLSAPPPLTVTVGIVATIMITAQVFSFNISRAAAEACGKAM